MEHYFPGYIESLDEMLIGVDEKALKAAHHDLSLTPAVRQNSWVCHQDFLVSHHLLQNP